MLGEIICGLTNATTAEEVIAAVASPELMQRIRATAVAEGTQVGALVASMMRQLIDHGAEDIWLDLLGVMSGSPQPGAAAIEQTIAHAFPDPIRVRIKRNGS